MDKWYNLNGKVVKNPKKDDFDGLQPSQIIEYKKGTAEDLIIETWWVGNIENNEVIDFAYSPSMLELRTDTLAAMRRRHFETHGVDEKVHFDKCYVLPPSYFTENSVKIPKYC